MFSIMRLFSPQKAHVCITLCALFTVAVLLAACSPVANPSKQVLLLKTEKGDIGVAPSTVEVRGGTISAEMHTNFSQSAPGETTNIVWNASFSVPTRVLDIRSVMHYDSRRNSFREEFNETGYYFIDPGSKLDQTMQALVGYCQSRGLSVDTTPVPCLTQGFQFADGAGNFFRFFDPASVKHGDGSLEFTMIGLNIFNGEYTTQIVNVDLSQKKMRMGPGKRYDGKGIFIADAAPVEWFDYLPKSELERMLDIILEYHRKHSPSQ